MNILIVGSGGREHALAWSFLRHDQKRKIFCANGNAGIGQIAECVDISPTDIEGLVQFAVDRGIDLTFFGGETSLALGIVDAFEAEGLRIVGPSKSAARLEASKAFAKDFMIRHAIPTADYSEVRTVSEGLEQLDSGKFSCDRSGVVIKADGLAAGKGVVVAPDLESGKTALKAIFAGEIVAADAAQSVVIEECLVGKEVSLILFTDGKAFALMPPTRDHKRIGEGDTGDNTGGMGTITDSSLLTKDETERIVREIVLPTLDGARAEGFPVKGILFLGLMMTASGPKVLEYNIRFGDPETQAILVNLETDLVEICNSIIDETLGKVTISWKEGSSACVILAAENYPKTPKTGDQISGIGDALGDECIQVFHSGTKYDADGRLVTGGGRVLGVTSTASILSNAIHRVYKAVNRIEWEGMTYRRDIGGSTDD
jgi:phosphoribosylamine--glycine ligase